MKCDAKLNGSGEKCDHFDDVWGNGDVSTRSTSDKHHRSPRMYSRSFFSCSAHGGYTDRRRPKAIK